MDGLLWQMIVINVITPSFPFIFPIRVALTVAAVGVAPWWTVLILANLAGGLGMLPVYALARWKAADYWQARLGRQPTLSRLRSRWRNNMFVVQVLLNATPLPDVISGGLAGCERYPIWRFLLAQLLGRSFHNLPLVIGGLWLADSPWLPKLLGWLQHPLLWIGLVAAAAIWMIVQSRRTANKQ